MKFHWCLVRMRFCAHCMRILEQPHGQGCNSICGWGLRYTLIKKILIWTLINPLNVRLNCIWVCIIKISAGANCACPWAMLMHSQRRIHGGILGILGSPGSLTGPKNMGPERSMKLLAEERRVSGNGNWPKTEAKKEGGSHFRNMTSQWRNQRGQLTLPKCQEGPAPTWTFYDLLALKLFRRGRESWKLLTMRAHNIKIPERALLEPWDHLEKETAAKSGPSTPIYRSGSLL